MPSASSLSWTKRPAEGVIDIALAAARHCRAGYRRLKTMGCPGVDVQLGLDPGGEERQRVHDALVAKDVRSSDSYEGRRELAQIAGTQLSPAQKAYGGLGPDFFADRSWGFCQSVLDTGAYGWNGGFGSSWLVDPSCDLVVIVLTQRMFESADLPQVHPDIQAAAYAALS